ncbi:MAG: hypothetical protein A4E41_01296 [Methanoregulaceae archaeon PtaU1.Bin066]|nr:MAG: hypothetical protein A4E41_01296 [Methanoregulaceae archaeon PtaU1.Bin066]
MVSPSITLIIRARMWSARIVASGKRTRSHEELVRSRSSQRVLFCRAGSTADRTTRERPQTCSLLMGFLLCGMVLDPTCRAPNASSTSPISVLCSVRIPMPILSRVVATFARNMKYSAYLSLETTWFETSTAVSPRYSIIVAWISIPLSPSAAWVPTAPVSCPTSTRGAIWPSRSMCRATSLAQMANRRP